MHFLWQYRLYRLRTKYVKFRYYRREYSLKRLSKDFTILYYFPIML